MKKVMLLVLLVGVLMFSCSKPYYPEQKFNSEFVTNDGMGNEILVEYVHLMDTIINTRVFNEVIRNTLNEAEWSLNHPLSFVPKTIHGGKYTGDEPFIKYTILIEYHGVNSYGVLGENNYVYFFNENGKCINSSLRKIQTETLLLKGFSDEEITNIFNETKGLPLDENNKWL